MLHKGSRFRSDHAMAEEKVANNNTSVQHQNNMLKKQQIKTSLTLNTGKLFIYKKLLRFQCVWWNRYDLSHLHNKYGTLSTVIFLDICNQSVQYYKKSYEFNCN